MIPIKYIIMFKLIDKTFMKVINEILNKIDPITNYLILAEKYDLRNICFHTYCQKYQNKLIWFNDIGFAFYVYNESTKLYNHQIKCWDHFLTYCDDYLIKLKKYYEFEFSRSEYFSEKELHEIRLGSNMVIHERVLLSSKTDPDFVKYSFVGTKLNGEINAETKIGKLYSEMKFYNELTEELDNVKYLLPVRNGIIDLMTGLFRERNYDDYYSSEVNAEWKGLDYDTRDVDQIFSQAKDLQKILGQSLYVNKNILYVFQGSNFLKSLLSKLLGDQCGELNGPRHKLSRERIIFAREHYADKSIQQLLKNEYTKILNNKSANQLILITDCNPRAVIPKSMKKKCIIVPFNIKNDNSLFDKLDQLLVWLVRGAMM